MIGRVDYELRTELLADVEGARTMARRAAWAKAQEMGAVEIIWPATLPPHWDGVNDVERGRIVFWRPS